MRRASQPEDDSATPYGGRVLPVRITRSAATLTAALLLFAAAGAAWAAPLAAQSTWHARQIHVTDAHKAGFHGKGVVIGILDGWVDTTHPDFGDRVRPGADCTSGTCSTTVKKVDCGSGHGTHVGGTLTASSYGVADRATLLPVRVLTQDSSGDCAGTPTTVAAGIRWAVDQGATVLNLSLGPDVPNSGNSTTLADAVREAAAADVVVVFSAGNADLPVAQSYGDDALVVAATTSSGQLASYSQHGQGVSVAAPGGAPTSSGACTQARCITSLYPGGGYAVAAGTSMAAPHVAGLAALIRAAHPTWTALQVRKRITDTARPLSGAGAGLVDAAAALGVKVSGGATSSPKARTTKAPAPQTVPVVRTPSPSASPAASPSATPSPATTPSPVSPSPVVTASPAPIAGGSTPSTGDEVPLHLAVIAAMLVAMTAAAVFALPRL
jgi:subtilisin family serine protease